MEQRTKNLLEIHIAVLLMGMTGLFGRAIEIPAQYITLGRSFFASVSMGIYFLLTSKNIRLANAKEYIAITISGILLAFHWTTFYTSVQVSTVAIVVLTFSAYPIFVTFLEPLLFKERLRLIDLIFAIVMFIGVIIIVPEFNMNNNLTVGLLWGMGSSLSFALLSLQNRRFAMKYHGSVIAFYEQGVAALILMPLLLFYRPEVSAKDWGLLILLGILFTGIAHSMLIGGMKNVRAQTAGIIASLETVYGIIFAALLINEIPTLRDIIGGVIILGAAALSTIRSSKKG